MNESFFCTFGENKGNLSKKFSLSLLKTLSSSSSQTGFTLVELMIVVAVIGLLSAVALPRYLSARGAASAGASIGQITGLAKECASFAASGGIGTAPTNCGTTGGSFASGWGTSVNNLRCLGSAGNGAAATIGVSSSGALSCTIG